MIYDGSSKYFRNEDSGKLVNMSDRFDKSSLLLHENDVFFVDSIRILSFSRLAESLLVLIFLQLRFLPFSVRPMTPGRRKIQSRAEG